MKPEASYRLRQVGETFGMIAWMGFWYLLFAPVYQSFVMYMAQIREGVAFPFFAWAGAGVLMLGIVLSTVQINPRKSDRIIALVVVALLVNAGLMLVVLPKRPPKAPQIPKAAALPGSANTKANASGTPAAQPDGAR
ncbi:MAG TPA: hypothetical protein VK970_18470 [Candidatus Methylacidiphilales bacterium]|nr:hypothetical protein [Candidatus Methylacidiphilales bacterium]